MENVGKTQDDAVRYTATLNGYLVLRDLTEYQVSALARAAKWIIWEEQDEPAQ